MFACLRTTQQETMLSMLTVIQNQLKTICKRYTASRGFSATSEVTWCVIIKLRSSSINPFRQLH